jgi:hypothetical protein
MIVWGGAGTDVFNSGGRYCAQAPTHVWLFGRDQRSLVEFYFVRAPAAFLAPLRVCVIDQYLAHGFGRYGAKM